MPIRKTVVATPFPPDVPGDEFRRAGNVIEMVRAGVVIASRPVVLSTQLVAAERVGPAGIIAFFEEYAMPGQIVTLVAVTKNNTTGSVTFRYSNGDSLEFASWNDAKSAVAYLDTQPLVCEHALVAKTAANSPDGTNIENMVGASMSADFSADVPFVLTEPVG